MPFDYPEAGASVPASGTIPKEQPMALKPYAVTINGYQTTLLLSDEDAKAQGLTQEAPKPAPAAKKTAAKQAPVPANKARKAPNKSKG